MHANDFAVVRMCAGAPFPADSIARSTAPPAPTTSLPIAQLAQQPAPLRRTRLSAPCPPTLTLTAVLLALWLGACENPRQGAHQEPGAGTHEAAPQGEPGDHAEHDEHEEGLVRLSAAAVARIGLKTEAVERRVLVGRLTVTGKLGFNEERLAHLSPRTSGRLARISARLGQEVAAGEVMATVDSIELGEAKAAFLRAASRRYVAGRQFEKERALHEDLIISEQALIEAEGIAKEAAADHVESRETLRLLGMAEAEIEACDWDETQPSYLAVRAPFAGRVVERDATLGELVDAGDTLFVLADLDTVWLWIDIYERDLSQVRLGQAVEIRFDAWLGEVFSGEVSYLGDRLDAETRTLRTRVDVPNPERRLRPGMFGRASIVVANDDLSGGVAAVPRTAVQRHHERSVVFVRREPGVFERRLILPGLATEHWVEAAAGVEPGEHVVVEGAFLLKSQTSAEQLGGHHH